MQEASSAYWSYRNQMSNISKNKVFNQRRVLYWASILFITTLLPVGVLNGAGNRDIETRGPIKFQKQSESDYWHYTTVGQFGLTITNFGVIGEGYNNPDQPSCMYKQYPNNIKEQVEHMSYGGLWVGGLVNDVPRVSTAIVDGVFDYGSEGFEFTAAGDTITERSTIPTSRHYSPEAISHQDFIARFTDMNTSGIANHIPLNIDVMLETYAWNYSFAEAFVILNYKIINRGVDNIYNIYAGLWADAAVGNMNYTNIYEPGGGWSWYDNLNGFDQTIFDPMPEDDFPGIDRDFAYQYDADGDNGYAESYIGFSCLGSDNVPREYWDTYYNQWPWQTSSDMVYPEYVMPMTDAERYEKMKTMLPRQYGDNWTEEGFPNEPRSWMILISAGPFGSVQDAADSAKWYLPPGDTLNVVYALACGKWATGDIIDNAKRRTLLQGNLDWAQKAYNGEDSNSNGVLDEGEDQDGDGILDRYILPAPPPSPKLHIVSERGKATLYWNNFPEKVKDPISRIEDFEGYRIYGHRKTSTVESEWTLLAQFDLKNEYGYNTGMDYVRIKDEAGNPSFVIFDGDTFHYKFENANLLNGWPERNQFSITSYDSGDPKTNLISLESSILENRQYVIVGNTPDDTEDFKPGVYPNPYRTQAIWDGQEIRDRMIWFTGLPSRSVIRIYTIAGELVDEIEHDAGTYRGSDIQHLEELSAKNVVMAGGEHAWDLISKYDQAIATGLYLFSVENLATGKIKTGRFLVIK
jgi:hypothetical protein